MTQRKTADLDSVALNHAVALAARMGVRETHEHGFHFVQTYRREQGGYWGLFCPATNWADGGPLIEVERIQVEPDHECGLGGQWFAHAKPAHYDGQARRVSSWKVTRSGPTALVAAMRAYVAIRLGDTVELP